LTPSNGCTSPDPELSLETDDSQDVLKQNQEEEHAGDAAKQQTNEVRIAFGIAEPDALPSDEARYDQENNVDERFQFACEFEHGDKLAVHYINRQPIPVAGFRGFLDHG
jgi:hypothetical protein